MSQSSVEYGSVSQLIQNLRQGDSHSATQIWNRYLHRLTGQVCRRLASVSKRVADEEDVVAKTFTSFFNALEQGRYAELQNRDELWRLLVTIADSKATDQVRFQKRQKRGDGVRGDSAFTNIDGSENSLGISGVCGPDPTPQLVVLAEESLRRLMRHLDHLSQALPDGELHRITQYKLEGFTNVEIAEKIGRSVPTVERRVRLIKQAWYDLERE